MNIAPRNTRDDAAQTVGGNVDKSEADLMYAYTVREGGDVSGLMQRLNVQGNPENVSLKGLQLIAEQRYQHSGRIYTMFSELLNKIDQMKQRLIQKFGQG